MRDEGCRAMPVRSRQKDVGLCPCEAGRRVWGLACGKGARGLGKGGVAH